MKQPLAVKQVISKHSRVAAEVLGPSHHLGDCVPVLGRAAAGLL